MTEKTDSKLHKFKMVKTTVPCIVSTVTQNTSSKSVPLDIMEHFLNLLMLHNLKWTVANQMNWSIENTADMNISHIIPCWPIEYLTCISTQPNPVQKLEFGKLTLNFYNPAKVVTANIVNCIIIIYFQATRRDWQQ